MKNLLTATPPPIMNVDPTSRRRTQKLKTPVTRDSFLTWNLNHQSYCRQDASLRKFLPGGTMSTWKALDEDKTRGILIMKADDDGNKVTDVDATDNIRSALSEFLSLLGAYCQDKIKTLQAGD